MKPAMESAKGEAMEKQKDLWFDYTLQVWVRDGFIEPCSHPASMGPECCNGRKMAGQAVEKNENCI